MENFETTSVVDQKTFEELKRHIRPPKERLHMVAYIVFFLLLGLACIILRIPLFAVLCFCIAACGGIIVPWRTQRRLIQLELRRMREVDSSDTMKTIVSFADSKIKILNERSQASNFLDYDIFERFVATENMYTLFTKENQFVTVNRKSLIAEGKEKAFVAFVRENCVNVKWTWKQKYPPRKILFVICLEIILLTLFVLAIYVLAGQTHNHSNQFPDIQQLFGL